MLRRTVGKHWVTLAWCALLAGCASPTHYMGIDLTAREEAASRAESPTSARLNWLAGLLIETGCMKDAQRDEPQCKAVWAEFAETLVRASAAPQGLPDLPLVTLANMARAGSKQARLELGIRFEEGRGLARDLKRARSLYRQAATSSGGQVPVYSPAVGNSPGRVIMINTGPVVPGLPEAAQRLRALEVREDDRTRDDRGDQ